MKDYLIVGFGLAGINIAQELCLRKKSFTVMDHNFQCASAAAGGIINPLILKRFTKAWKADKFLPIAVNRYENLQDQLGENLFYRLPIYRKIKSAREQNDWFTAADNPDLSPFMATPLQQLKILPSPFQYGEVKQSYWLDTKKLIASYGAQLKERHSFWTATFHHEELQIIDGHLQYQNQKFKKVIFCEGFHFRQNPYFTDVPLIGNKGEYLLLKISGLQLTNVIKTALALIPLGNDYYKFGATYSRTYKDLNPESSSRDFLIKKLEKIIDCPYTVVDQIAGVRPTVLDRRPLLGAHPQHKNLLVLNGLGSHGIMMAPLAAQWLLDYDLQQKPLPKGVDIQRYTKA